MDRWVKVGKGRNCKDARWSIAHEWCKVASDMLIVNFLRESEKSSTFSHKDLDRRPGIGQHCGLVHDQKSTLYIPQRESF